MKRRRGFTLLELLVVIAIMGVLMALLLPAILKFKDKSRATRADVQVRAIGSAINAYRLRYHKWPAHNGDLEAGEDVTYGTEDRGNAIIFAKLEFPPDGNQGNPDEPVIDMIGFWKGDDGNVRCFNGDQFQVTLDLNEDFQPSGGVSVSWN
mgnify:CR=1 FL=1|jgi:type II secretion system protein G